MLEFSRIGYDAGMGEAKANLSRIIKSKDPICIYCGSAPSDDADHCPPKVVFTGKDRPKGLEFGVCRDCHEPTRQIDQIAASYGRMMPPPVTEAEKADIRKYALSLKNNQPEIAAIFGGPSYVNNQGLHITRVEGDNAERLHNAMLGFSARLGMALHREILDRPVAKDAYVFARYFSSHNIAMDEFPPGLFDELKNPRTLRAGKKEKSQEFLYDHVYDAEGDRFLAFAMFRESFACAIVITNEPPPEKPLSGQVFRPGFLRGFDWRQVPY